MTFISKNQFSSISKVFGIELLAYVLNIELKALIKLNERGGEISEPHAAIINNLTVHLENLKSIDPLSYQLNREGMEYIQNLKMPLDEYLFPKLRQISSREIPNLPQTGDSVLDALAELCRLSYPYLLIPVDSFDAIRNAVPHFCQTTELTTFFNAVVNDRDLKKLFHSIDDTQHRGETTGYIATSLGESGMFHLNQFHNNIISNAWTQMKLLSRQSLEEFVDISSSYICLIRKAINGEAVTSPTFIFFDGSGLTLGQKINLKDGDLCPVTAEMLPFLPPQAFTLPQFEPIQPNDVIGMMLVTNTELNIGIKHNPIDKEWDKAHLPSQMKTTGSIHKKASSIVLGTILATSSNKTAKLRHVGEILINPFRYSINIIRSWSQKADISIIDKHQNKEIEEWINIIKDIDTSKISMATRRFLLSTTSRTSSADSLIDAVIGLENLFGTKSEIAFAISNSVARLLEDDFEKRDAIFKEVKKIYSTRSKILHGGGEIEPKELSEDRSKAIYYLSSCIKILLKDKNELLEMSSADRVKTIALRD